MMPICCCCRDADADVYFRHFFTFDLFTAPPYDDKALSLIMISAYLIITFSIFIISPLLMP